MARSLYPAKHLTEQQKDTLRESAERWVLIKCARATNKKVFLKGGTGPDVEMEGIASKLVGSLPESEIIARDLLPDTDLNAGGVAFDQWQTQALVAATELQFVNQQIRTDQCVSVYGVFTMDANPGISRIRCLNGTSVVMTAWECQKLWAAEDSMGYADEFVGWDYNQTVSIFLMPFLTKAAGERFGFLGYIAEPKGTGPVTK